MRIVASGICHTDIRYVDDWYECPKGRSSWAMRAPASWSVSVKR